MQDSFHLARVCDYIHLNPVRTRGPGRRIAEFNASSLSHWLRGTAPDWLNASELLRETGVEHGAKPWPLYVGHLIRVATAGGDGERDHDDLMDGDRRHRELKATVAIGVLFCRRQ